MTSPAIVPYIIPTGGTILLDLPDYVVAPSGVASITLARAVSGVGGLSAFTQIYSGAPLPVYVDCGDLLPAPLLSGVSYVYQLTDARGTTQTMPLVPAGAMLSSPDGLTELFIRLLQAAVNNLVLPAGIARVQVDAQLPQGGLQALPFVVVNQDLWQQRETELGQDVPNSTAAGQPNTWTISILARRIWRVTVFSRNTKERDFYRDSLLSVFIILMANVFSKIGQDVHHDIQVASGTDAREFEGHLPGFYYADLLLDIEGSFESQVLTNYGLIAGISVTATTNTIETIAVVPNLSLP